MSLSRSLGLVATVVGFVIGAKVLRDNSLLTHLATGELIVDRQSVPRTDPYSRTAFGQAWTVQSWLISLVYATVERAGGPALLRILHGLVAAVVSAGIWRLTAPVRQLVPRFALALLPVVIGAGLWSPRPFMFGLAAMVLLLIVVQTDEPGWLLVPLFWLWVNSHGSFPLGLALLGALAVGQLIDRGIAAHRDISEGPYLAWAVGGTLLGAVNPIGPRILWFPVELLGRREALAGVVEWQPPSFTQPSELLFLCLVPVVAIAARRGAPWRALFPSLCFLTGGFLAIRNISVAAVVIVALLAPSLSHLYGTEDGSVVTVLSRTLGRAAVISMMVMAGIVMAEPGFDLTLYPVSEVDWLEGKGLAGSADAGLIHREAVGNYLAYRYGPESSVFIDDRFDFYPLSVTTDHMTLIDGGDYGEILDRRASNVVLWEADTVLADWLAESDRWDLTMADDQWIIACRIDSPVYSRCIEADLDLVGG